MNPKSTVALVVMLALLANATSALPDYAISQLTPSPSAPHVGQSVGVLIRTQNNGSYSPNSSITWANGPHGGEQYSVPPLAPGNYSDSIYIFNCTQVGNVLIQAYADWTNTVQESIEYNNARNATVYCRAESPGGKKLPYEQGGTGYVSLVDEYGKWVVAALVVLAVAWFGYGWLKKKR